MYTFTFIVVIFVLESFLFFLNNFFSEMGFQIDWLKAGHVFSVTILLTLSRGSCLPQPDDKELSKKETRK